MKNLGLCNRYKEEICAKEGESVSVVKREERRGERVSQGAIEKRIYPTLKVVSNSISVFCWKKEWKEENGTGL